MTSTLIQPVDKLKEGIGGGKTHGLVSLKKFGVQIPETFLITENRREEFSNLLKDFPETKKYAVRSSVSTEDGNLHSVAGQFQTFLNISGSDSLAFAVNECFQSLKSKKVNSYQQILDSNEKIRMFVLLQEMIDSRLSGVIFTIDPVANRHDKMYISFTRGAGEELMAGHEMGESITFFKHTARLPVLKDISDDLFRQLVNEALAIEKQYGKPADLEWAIDKNGKLWWLQLRPITCLQPFHLNEFDNQPRYKEPLYTRGNIGEMMPGPVTPLTLSTFVRAIELGMQIFYRSAGVIKNKSDEFLFIHSYYNHLFFDLNMMYEMPGYTLFMKKENIDFSVVGQIVDQRIIKRKVNLIKALRNFISVFKYMRQAPKSWVRLRIINKHFRLKCPDQIVGCFDLIDSNMPILFKAYDLHNVTSSQSVAFYTAILNFYSKGKLPGQKEKEKVAALFNNITNIESANVAVSIDELAELLSAYTQVREEFIEVDNEKSLDFLQQSAPQEIREEWAEFIRRHGHRCESEAEMREKEWAIDPSPVINRLKAKTNLFLSGQFKRINNMKEYSIEDNNLGIISRLIVNKMLPKARKAFARREHTKAWAIGVQLQFKMAYRQLAGLMVGEKLLEDADQIFFLQHQEIGKMIKSGQFDYWRNIANQRREYYSELQHLSFPEVVFGIPHPEEMNNKAHYAELNGIPVSSGIVEGVVRIVNTKADAKKLKNGEIMVAKFTDIGWTPFYSIISGLITEIGSPLSHGAEVAREYGLPAVVSMKDALTILKTGQKIKLNALKGFAEIIQ